MNGNIHAKCFRSFNVHILRRCIDWIKLSEDESRQLRKQKRITKRITKRFVKRSGKRVASAVLAAATFGTVAVAGAMTTVEISSYCDQKAGLPIEANILYGTYTEFDPDQCSNYAVACGIDCCNECIDGAGGVCVHIHGK